MAKKRYEDTQLKPELAEELKNEISWRIRAGKIFWRPLNVRQDYWASMYLLLDPVQQMKPLGYRRFVSNYPRSAVDTAISILTRNDSFWRIEDHDSPQDNQEARLFKGKIERMLGGVINEFDQTFTLRGQPPFWVQAAQMALLRGWIWGKAHVTDEALNYSSSPFSPWIYDPRTVYPHFDQWGLESVGIEAVSTLGDLAMNYPGIFGEYMRDTTRYDPNSPALRLEYWTNTRPGRPGVTGVLGIVMPRAEGGMTISNLGQFYENPLVDNMAGARWIVPPYYHEYTPEQLPIVGVPANGLRMDSKPQIHPVLQSRLQERADLLAIQTQAWAGPGTWQADTGRSILAAVEDQVPQYNELVATIFHHLSLSAFGTWVFHTPTGEIPDFEPSLEAKIGMRPEERVERVEMQPINQDAFRLMSLLQNEQQMGVLNSILTSQQGFSGTGVLFQQMANAAMNSLDPYKSAMERFGTGMASSILEQLKVARGSIKAFTVVGKARSRSYFQMEFDPSQDLDLHRKYRPVPVFKPALPDDLALRINAARLALDPRKPILSLAYVLENILQVDDAQGEIDRIWEDIANTDPVIVLEQIADALERLNEPEIANRIRQNEFRTQFVQDLQFRQQTGGQMPQITGGGGAPPNMPPEAGANPFATANNGAGNEGALGVAGAAILGAMGERGGP